MKELMVSTSKKTEVVDITDLVREKVSKEAKAILVYVPHATAAIVVNEYEQNIKADMEEYFASLAIRKQGTGSWRHDQIDDNAQSHLVSSVLSPEVLVPVEDGKMQLGTWQRILLVDLDGPRSRRIIVRGL
jgi:secondary thiamine-phosphate synthase enzyme